MPLTFNFIDQRPNVEALGNTPMWKNDTGKVIYTNAAKDKVVSEDSPEAAFVLVGKEGSLPVAEARKYGLEPNDTEDETRKPSDDKEEDTGEDETRTPASTSAKSVTLGNVSSKEVKGPDKDK